MLSLSYHGFNVISNLQDHSLLVFEHVGCMLVGERITTHTGSEDTLAERLRRRPAKPMGSPRMGSDPTGVDIAASWTLSPNTEILIYNLQEQTTPAKHPNTLNHVLLLICILARLSVA